MAIIFRPSDYNRCNATGSGSGQSCDAWEGIALGETLLALEEVDFEGGRKAVEMSLAKGEPEIELAVKQLPGTKAKQYFFNYYRGDELSRQRICARNDNF